MADSPYKSFPDTAFWRRSVAGVPGHEVSPLAGDAPFQVTPQDAVVAAGSCFAQHISRYLREAGFNALCTEPGHPIFAPQDMADYNYGTFTARYGNIYVARQQTQLIERAYGRFTPQEDIWEAPDGSLIDPFRPQIQPGGFASLAEYQADRTQHFAAVRKALETMDVFVFTLGLTEGWLSRQDGAVFPLCPGVAGGRFDPARHVFHNFTVSEIVADMVRAIDALRALRPGLRIVLTVSPVPLIATASGQHVLSATTYSKSVLRVAAAELEQRYDNLLYFPSYEVITGPHANYLADDLRSVREDGVNHVMRLFFKYLAGFELPARDLGQNKVPNGALQGRDRTLEAMQDAVRVACEEELLDTARDPNSCN